MFHVKQRIERLLHSIGCAVCNPLVVRRRRKFAQAARDNADVMFFDKLAQDVRRNRIRAVMADVGGEPWQVDYLTALLDRYRAGDQVVAVMPRQHPQTLVTRNFGHLVEQVINATLLPGRDL